jgi:prepilin-type processing-associated H-X9-DG protein
VDDDGGRLWQYPPDYLNTAYPYAYQGTAIQDWHLKHVGKTNEGWLCPSAPIRPLDPQRTNLPGLDGGTVNSAWQMRNGYWWGGWYGGIPPVLADRSVRFGSYSINSWLGGWGGWGPYGWGRSYLGVGGAHQEWAFQTEETIAQPSLTPSFADAVAYGLVMPTEFGWAAKNLVTGDFPSSPYTMSALTIPRHGSRPNHIPTDHPFDQRLPGAINVAFYDGHVELVPLERLWQLHWHRNWQTPAKRPGLR